MNLDKKTYVIVTVDTEFSSHKDDIGIFGRIGEKEYGISKIMNILDNEGVKATFFVDVYGYRKCGKRIMKDICLNIHSKGHDVQLHTHPDWIYDKNRGYMAKYSLEEQVEIIKHGKELLEDWIGEGPIAHRAGDWGANDNTIKALEVNNIPIDSSFFKQWPLCELDLPINNKIILLNSVLEIAPTTYISPSLGLFRPYKIIDIDSNPLLELKTVISKCRMFNINPIVLVLHSFSFLMWNRNRTKYWPDYSDIKKFTFLIQLLKENKQIHILSMKEFYSLYQQQRISEDLSSGVLPRNGYFLSLYRAFYRLGKNLRKLIL